MINLNKNKRRLNCGFTLVEVLIACSIITVSMFVLMGTAQRGVSMSNLALSKSQASLLLEEGAEAVRSIRDNNFTTISSLNLDTPYHLFFNTTTRVWVLDQSVTNLSGSIPSYPIDGSFDRTITISSVGRDANDDIVDTGGTIDPKTKKITVTLSWSSSDATNTKSLSFYITDIFN
ncbi:MAG: prepilin-type N-terminal cleavage/methylation domain-containing protein [Candidatus Paceibacterota bacterium]|jgi:prepilin-type N-terminal cleavage/methylation domain-containing protein